MSAPAFHEVAYWEIKGRQDARMQWGWSEPLWHADWAREAYRRGYAQQQHAGRLAQTVGSGE